jgi:hypothetical protein
LCPVAAATSDSESQIGQLCVSRRPRYLVPWDRCRRSSSMRWVRMPSRPVRVKK